MNMSWYPLARQELLDVLERDMSPIGRGESIPHLSGADVVLGMSQVDDQNRSFAGVALVGSARKELFSWALTYAEEAFPLTQFCRVCSVEDWSELNLAKNSDVTIGSVDPIWPSIVLGEMMGQMDGEPDVAGTPKARASACFSYAFARTMLLYGRSRVALRKCVERLNAIEKDGRFARRHISTNSLREVWSVAEHLTNVSRNWENAVEIALRIVSAIDSSLATTLGTNRPLLSDSAEDRVIGFDAAVDTLIHTWGASDRQRTTIGLACAAVLAGRGTSHIKLLAPWTRSYPEVLVWYGLLVGIMGPRVWDKAWMQQAKGVERSLRQFFRLDEPVIADVCWPEYEWLSTTYSSPRVLGDIPKSTPRSLAIEILPGVSGQFRFMGPEGNLKPDDRRLTSAMSIKARESDPESVIAYAVELLNNVQRHLREKTSSASAKSAQGSLFEGDSSGKKTRVSRRKGAYQGKREKPDKGGL